VTRTLHRIEAVTLALLLVPLAPLDRMGR
jgi:hypothetical protein